MDTSGTLVDFQLSTFQSSVGSIQLREADSGAG